MPQIARNRKRNVTRPCQAHPARRPPSRRPGRRGAPTGVPHTRRRSGPASLRWNLGAPNSALIVSARARSAGPRVACPGQRHGALAPGFSSADLSSEIQSLLAAGDRRPIGASELGELRASAQKKVSRLRETLQVHLTSILEGEALANHKAAHRFSHQDLPAGRCTAHPGRQVDDGAEQIVVEVKRLACAEPHPNGQADGGVLVARGQRLLRLCGRGQRQASPDRSTPTSRRPST